MTDHPTPPVQDDDGFVPCPLCKQYSHSIGEDKLAEALNHFQSMFSHRGDGIPTQFCFDEQTRDAAQVLMTASRLSPTPETGLVEAQGWRPIETAPLDGTSVFVANHSSLCPAYFYVGAWRNWFKGPRYENVNMGAAAFAPEEIWFEPTHWQPLPAPPAISNVLPDEV